MTDLRKAADMAHEALVMWEQLDPHHSLNVVRAPAINALAEALAQPDEVAVEREKFCAVLRKLHDSLSCASDSTDVQGRGDK